MADAADPYQTQLLQTILGLDFCDDFCGSDNDNSLRPLQLQYQDYHSYLSDIEPLFMEEVKWSIKQSFLTQTLNLEQCYLRESEGESMMWQWQIGGSFGGSSSGKTNSSNSSSSGGFSQAASFQKLVFKHDGKFFRNNKRRQDRMKQRFVAQQQQNLNEQIGGSSSSSSSNTRRNENFSITMPRQTSWNQAFGGRGRNRNNSQTHIEQDVFGNKITQWNSGSMRIRGSKDVESPYEIGMGDLVLVSTQKEFPKEQVLGEWERWKQIDFEDEINLQRSNYGGWNKGSQSWSKQRQFGRGFSNGYSNNKSRRVPCHVLWYCTQSTETIIALQVLSQQFNQWSSSNSQKGGKSWFSFWFIAKVTNLTTHVREYKVLCGLHSKTPLWKEIILLQKNQNPQWRQVQQQWLQAITNQVAQHPLLQELQKSQDFSQFQATLSVATATWNQAQSWSSSCVPNANKSAITLIQGPPGTGKSKTILGIISVLRLKPQSKILVCAPSNEAVDNLVRRIRKDGLLEAGIDQFGKQFVFQNKNPSIVRIGAGYSEDVEQVSAEWLIYEKMFGIGGGKKDLKQNNRRGGGKKGSWTWSSSSFGTSKGGNNNKGAGGNSNYNTQKAGSTSKAALMWAIIENADVVLATCSAAATLGDGGGFQFEFESVVIDEACQSSEPCVLVPLQFGWRRLVLVGDPDQLPPTIISQKAKSYNYDRSLFERLMQGTQYLQQQQQKQQHPHPHISITFNLLQTQYRMHPAISYFPAKFIYNNNLKDGRYRSEESLGPGVEELQAALLFVDCEDGVEDEVSTSKINISEATHVCNMVKFLYQSYPGVDWSEMLGVISFYKEQVKLIRERVWRMLVTEGFLSVDSNSSKEDWWDSFDEIENMGVWDMEDVAVQPEPGSNSWFGFGSGSGGAGFRQQQNVNANGSAMNIDKSMFGAESKDQSQQKNKPMMGAWFFEKLCPIDVNTVDGFQGAEKEIIILSTVRANWQGKVGFVWDKRRLNVAITRARRHLIVVGHADTLAKGDEMWRQFIQHIRTFDAQRVEFLRKIDQNVQKAWQSSPQAQQIMWAQQQMGFFIQQGQGSPNQLQVQQNLDPQTQQQLQLWQESQNQLLSQLRSQLQEQELSSSGVLGQKLEFTEGSVGFNSLKDNGGDGEGGGEGSDAEGCLLNWNAVWDKTHQEEVKQKADKAKKEKLSSCQMESSGSGLGQQSQQSQQQQNENQFQQQPQIQMTDSNFQTFQGQDQSQTGTGFPSSGGGVQRKSKTKIRQCYDFTIEEESD